MSHLSLKVTVVELGTTKTIHFTGDMSAYEACKEIREKFGAEAGGSDHGIFWPAQTKWLANNKVLDFYDLTSGDEVEFKKKHRPLRVRTMDGSVKTVLIDESLPVQAIVVTVCERIGVANPEEYSFLPDGPMFDEGGTVRGTMRKKGKAHIEEEAKWLNAEKTLREQGFTENDSVLLKKKFFFSDQNIDRNDPVQLNLLYNQAREMIVSGKHPCTKDEAGLFGAIQLQTQYGNHEPDKHRPGFVKMKEFVPPEYVKNKDVEKKMYSEHSKLQGLNELNAKFRYVQLSRSLKTYGITFFLVKERAEKKSKLVEVLLGVTKESVVRLDVESKDVIKTWRLTQLRRWAASPNSFTLDFGDYADAYYSVLTTEGEQISQLIAGYIDIILKKKKAADRQVPDEEEEHAAVEEYVRPGRAQAVGLAQAAQRAGNVQNVGQVQQVDMQRMQFARQGPISLQYADYGADVNGDLQVAQQTLLTNMQNGHAAIANVLQSLGSALELPPMGSDPASMAWREQTRDVNGENIASQIASYLAAAGSLVIHATGDVANQDYDRISANMATICSSLGQMSTAIKMLAALCDNAQEGNELLSCARRLATSLNGLLAATRPVVLGEAKSEHMYQAIRDLTASSNQMLAMLKKVEVPEDDQKELVVRAKAVENASRGFAEYAQRTSAGIRDKTAANQVLLDANAVTQLASQLLACTGVLAPMILSPLCLDQLLEGSVLLQDSVETTSLTAQGCNAPKALRDLQDSTQQINDAIAKLVEKAKHPIKEEEVSELDLQYDRVVNSVDMMLSHLGSGDGIVGAARDLTVTATTFINALKASGGGVEADERKRLASAAHNLAEATARMVAAAKDAARNPSDMDRQVRLKDALAELQEAAGEAIGARVRQKAFQKLAKAAKDAVSSSNQIITASKNAAPSNRNQASQQQLNLAAKRVAEVTPTLVTAIKAYNADPEDTNAQMRLVNASKQLIVPGQSLNAASRAAAPTTGDQAAQAGLISAAQQNSTSLEALSKTFELAESIKSGFQLESALEVVQKVHADMVEACGAPSKVKAQPGQTVESSQLEIQSVTKSMIGAIGQMTASMEKGDEKFMGIAATDLVNLVQALSAAAKAVCGTSNDPDTKSQILEAAANLAAEIARMLEAAKAGRDGTAVTEAALKDLAHSATEAVTAIAQCLPGQRDIDRVRVTVERLQSQIASGKLAQLGNGKDSFQTAQNKLEVATNALVLSMNNLVAATKGTPSELIIGVKGFESSINKLAEAAGSFAGKDAETAEKIQALLSDVFTASAALLSSTKLVAADPTNGIEKSRLMDAVRSVGESLSKLMEGCAVSAPGQSECNKALQTLAIANARLDAVNDATPNNDTYAESLAIVSSQVKQLSSQLNSMLAAARSGDANKLASGVTDVSDLISSITEANCRAVCLIGLADPSSVAATSGAVDTTIFSKTTADMRAAFDKLVNPNNKQQDVVEHAAQVAKHTAALCNACKKAGADPAVSGMARQRFNEEARDIAAITQDLVQSIKVLAVKPSEVTRSRCVAAFAPLLEKANVLVEYTRSGEFAGEPARFSPMAQASQRPLVDSNRNAIGSAQGVFETSRMLCATPKDSAAIQLLQSQVKSLTDAIQSLTSSIASGAPGQQECDEALEKITDTVAALDGAVVDAMAGRLKAQPGQDPSHLVDTGRALVSLADVIGDNAKSNGAELGASVLQLPATFAQFASYAGSCAAGLKDANQQKSLLEAAKDVGDLMLAFLHAAKANGGNSLDIGKQQQVDAQRELFQASIKKVTAFVEGTGEETAEFTAAADHIEAGLKNFKSKIPARVGETYQAYATQVDTQGKQLLEAIGEAISKAKTREQFAALANRVSTVFDDIILSSGCAIAASDDPSIKQSITEAVRDLGGALMRLLDASRLASRGTDNVNRSKLSSAARETASSTSNLLNAVREGSKGIIACENANSNLSSLIGDMETTTIFAQAGQLDPMDSKDNFGRHKDAILTNARQLIELTKRFIAAATGTQNDLADVAGAAVQVMASLMEHSKAGATAVTSADKNMQVQLLAAVRAVAESLQGLVTAAGVACGQPENDPSMNDLGDSVKMQFGAVAELIRVAKLLGDEASRGIRALEGAASEIDEAITVLESQSPAQGTALPEEVAAIAKQLATASAGLVSASNGAKQDDVVAACNHVKNVFVDLSRAGKAATEKAPAEKRKDMHRAVIHAGESTKMLLGTVKGVQEAPTPEHKQQVQNAAKEVAAAVATVMQSCGALIPGGYVDPNDPNVIAERELLAAASSIEAAARKLAQMKPPERPRQANEELGFDEQIFEATQAIASACAALIKSATGAQREIVAQQGNAKKSDKVYYSDGTWSDGLVSAAKAVAAATGDLCAAADAAVKGNVDRERVIVAARNVSASTTQLLSAAATSVDPNSQSQIRLQAAGKAVTSAADQLCKAADQSMMFDDAEQITSDLMKGGATNSRVVEMEAQVSILKMEKELENARKKLAAVRKGKYDVQTGTVRGPKK
ncbi:hypothetical protein SmJEL517_g04801 [Synchytrium microbalum]|uniref:FERM domain-containing protein n=1 Tax=Synchytrium microbalum TaxID=1806994 RepID=A0A507C3A5_9FUNG|nr:uncharacterized protein SmJEL517_g04801 [Synchytrium microbalum]TPX31993.1 hypothetical protein SmJEL517_g04801 [Synchytrium microbalum]